MFDLVLFYAAADSPAAEPLPDLVMWSGLVGFGMPPLVAIINQATWASWVRAIVTLLLCVAAGAGTAYFDGNLTGQRWTTAALIVATAAIASYRMFWRPSGIAPGIEAATTPSPRRF